MYEEESIYQEELFKTVLCIRGYKNSRVQLRQNVQMYLGTNVIFGVLLMQT